MGRQPADAPAALARTVRHRPDLIEARGGITDDERRLLAEFSFDPDGSEGI